MPVMSGAMHPIDRIAGIASAAAPLFPEGFGDPALLDLLDRTPQPSDPIDPVSVAWRETALVDGLTRRQGTFESPLAGLLPDRATTGHVEIIESSGQSSRLCLLLPAWNDEGFRSRRPLARLLADRGISSLSLINPLYGRRRVRTGGPAVTTVGEFGLMGYVAVHEARALLAHFRNEYRVGLAGYSMGAGFTAGTSTTVPFPVAVAALAASPSPARVFAGRVMGRRLRGELQNDGRRLLVDSLDRVSVLRRTPLPHHSAAVLVAAAGDGFVPVTEARSLHDHWPGSDLRVYPGGHVTLWMLGKPMMARAVADAFDRLHGWPGED